MTTDPEKVKGPVPHAVILDETWQPASPENDERLLISFSVGRYGRDDDDERKALAQRMLRELKLKFPDVEPGGLRLIGRKQ